MYNTLNIFLSSQVNSAWGLVRGCQEVRSAVMASIPDDVRELCDGCLRGRRVTFSPSSSLERIGVSCVESKRFLYPTDPKSIYS